MLVQRQTSAKQLGMKRLIILLSVLLDMRTALMRFKASTTQNRPNSFNEGYSLRHLLHQFFSITFLISISASSSCTSAPYGAHSDISQSVPNDASVDGSLHDLASDETEPLDGACRSGSGCFGQPCTGGAECESGWCVKHEGRLVCSRLCDMSPCPAGWACESSGSDFGIAAPFCVSLAATLCMPCWEDSTCAPTGSAGARCVSFGPLGSFCGAPCNVDQDCPDSYSCAHDSQGGQCKPQGGNCGCSPLAVQEALDTECLSVNQWGTCSGHRVCTPEGLSDCDAPTPAQEICDAVDNDCDGSTDEDLPTVACGLGACEHSQQACVGGEEVECDPMLGAADETPNGIDDNCNGIIDEDPYWPEGMGTSDNPYIITTIEDLKHIAQYVASGSTYLGAYFRLENDIDLDYIPWAPIGTSEAKPFSGTVDGNGFAIINLYIKTDQTYCGLFGYVRKATILNLSIKGNAVISGKQHTGAIAGYADQSTIINCSNTEQVGGSGVSCAGGIVGTATNSSLIDTCINFGSVSCTVSGDNYPDCSAGGLVGCAAAGSIITHSQNEGGVKASATSTGGSSSASSERAIGDAGGIVGLSNGSSISDCTNTGAIKGTSKESNQYARAEVHSGGLVGRCQSGALADCMNSGEVRTEARDEDNTSGSVSNYSGGIAGIASGVEFSRCNNTGHIAALFINMDGTSTNGVDTDSGGIAGSATNSVLSYCSNTGSVVAESAGHGCSVGGLIGTAGTGVDILKCWSRASTYCSSTPSAYTIVPCNIGSLIGSSKADTILHTFGKGSAWCSAQRCDIGGLIGMDASANIGYSYSATSLVLEGVSQKKQGCIIGNSYDGSFVHDVYFDSLLCGVAYGNGTGTSMTTAQMQDLAFVETLNSGQDACWLPDSDGSNGGYPIIDME